ncbi:hypothetical protein [Kitasatospora phosalacinea]|uniref:Uncharacterized protein n=1 Tax=Kitasatospora phosalacinea TaxID=2065 RepID=A0ABW6GXC3_9ACTN
MKLVDRANALSSKLSSAWWVRQLTPARSSRSAEVVRSKSAAGSALS